MVLALKKVLFLQSEAYFCRLLGDSFYEETSFECVFSLPSIVSNVNDYIAGFDAVATCLDHSAESAFLVNVAKKVGVASIYVSDGTYDIGNSIYNNHLRKHKNFQLFGVAYDHVLLPDLIAGKLFSSYGATTSCYLPVHATCEASYSESGYLLISTANSSYFSRLEFEKLCELVKTTTEFCEKEKIEYRFRVYDPKIVDALAIPDELNLIDCGLSQALNGARALFTTPSTLVYSAASCNIPVGVYNYRNVFVTQPYSFLLSDEAAIFQALQVSHEENMYRLRLQSSFVEFESPIRILDAIVCCVDEKKGLAAAHRRGGVFIPFESFSRAIYRKLLVVSFMKKFFKKIKGL